MVSEPEHPNIQSGLYEQLITDLLAKRLETQEKGSFYIQSNPVAPLEAARYLTKHVASAVYYALNSIPVKDYCK